jgi:hypothetical protein
MGKIRDSIHRCGSFPFFQIELLSFMIPERKVLPPAWISSGGMRLLPGDLSASKELEHV